MTVDGQLRLHVSDEARDLVSDNNDGVGEKTGGLTVNVRP